MTRVISVSEVNKHQDKDSVWMVIHNDVYDVTKFLEEHPGGEEALLDFAGKEATQAFEDVGHSADARELLKKFKIGTLPEEERNTPQPTTAPTPTYCPRVDKLMNADNDSNKSWRDFDGSEPRQRKSKPKVRIDPNTAAAVNTIIVPTTPTPRRSRGEPCGSGAWKWYVLALLGAIAIGVLIKKKMEA